jgi:hypothetical protein
MPSCRGPHSGHMNSHGSSWAGGGGTTWPVRASIWLAPALLCRRRSFRSPLSTTGGCLPEFVMYALAAVLFVLSVAILVAPEIEARRRVSRRYQPRKVA